jgi:predicted nucleotidyltransferase
MDLPIDVDALCRRLRDHGVRFALIYGSHAKGVPRTDSDVDIAVWSDGPVVDWGLRGELADVVDLLDLRSAPDGVAGRVAMEGLVLFEDDPVARIRWQADTRKRHLDERFRRERFQRDFVRAHG